MKSFKREVTLFLALFIGTILVVTQTDLLTNKVGGWHIENSACIGCGGCATDCVLPQSAVTAQIDQTVCIGKADCPAYFKGGKIKEGRENQNCPTGAFIRTANNDGTYTYSIDASKCIGCGKCTYLCQKKGEGALTLLIDSDKCVDCHECQIGKQCPTEAISRQDKEDK